MTLKELIDSSNCDPQLAMTLCKLVATECENQCLEARGNIYFPANTQGAVIQDQVIMDCISKIKEWSNN